MTVVTAMTTFPVYQRFPQKVFFAKAFPRREWTHLNANTMHTGMLIHDQEFRDMLTRKIVEPTNPETDNL
jgi:hypothetical protein